MRKLLTLGLGAAALVAIGLAIPASAMATDKADNTITVQDDAPKPCVRTSFKTAGVKAACKKGGQKAAKGYMKGVLKKGKKNGVEGVKNCKSCHSKLGPNYELKPDGLKLFKAVKASKAPDAPSEYSPIEQALLKVFSLR